MKKLYALLSLLIILVFSNCSSSKFDKTSDSTDIQKQIAEKNRGNISLLTRVRQLPGVSIRYGKPVITKTANSINSSGSVEPLYILNDYPVGQSFESVNGLVDNFNVKKIKVLSDQEASFYGSRAAQGVIKITTYD